MTYNKDRAKVEPRTQEEWLDLILNDGTEYWGNDITDRDTSAIHEFYDPFAGRLAELEEMLKEVHEALRVEDAEGQELDYIGKKLGVIRRDAEKSTGHVTFQRDSPATKDYLVQEGTTVKTSGEDPIKFDTTEKAIILGPIQSTDEATKTTSNTNFIVKKTSTVDVENRDSVKVGADLKTNNNSYTASVEIADSTNSNIILSNSTTNTSFTSFGETSYDVSSLSGKISVEYRIKISNNSTTAEITNFYLEKGGETASVAGIEASNKGSRSNVAANTILASQLIITGVDSLTNKTQTTGGRAVEEDTNYRNRITSTIGEVEVTSGREIYRELLTYEFVKDVSYIDNSTDNVENNLNPHQVELVVDAEFGHKDEIAQAIWDNASAGANIVGGKNGELETGTASLPNGQTYTIEYSTPTRVNIFVDADLTLEEDVSTEKVKNAIVDYIGGATTNGSTVYGDLGVGEDVLYGEVEFSLRNVAEVYDVTTLSIGTSASPSGTSNISISDKERSLIDVSDINITKNIQ